MAALISVDVDDSRSEQTDEIAEYLRAVDDVLTYYNEHGQIKHVCVFLPSFFLSFFIYLFIYLFIFIYLL